MDLEELSKQLYDIGAIKFGNFKLKSGIWSPFYFDLRVIVSYPEILKKVSDCLNEKSKEVKYNFTRICGVPYTALPIATLMSVENNVPMLIRRKEAKDYGTKKMVEGNFEQGDICLVVEDVVSSGMSILETVQSLKDVGVVVKDAVVLLDREQNGSNHISDNGITMHSVFKISEMVLTFLKSGRMQQAEADKIKIFLASVKEIDSSAASAKKEKGKGDGGGGRVLNGNGQVCKAKTLSFETRSKLVTNPTLKRLFGIMQHKSTNLCLSADVSCPRKLLELADKLGPYICVLKTHMDALDNDPEGLDASSFITSLTALADKHDFLLFEDRKYADIGNTVSKQFSAGVYKVNEWAHLINAHALPGPGVLAGLKKVNKKSMCLLVAEMSCADNLITPEYTNAVVKMAEENREFVAGFISQNKLTHDPNFLHFTPGVHLRSKGDSQGQQYSTPTDVIACRGVDVIIVGRGITEAEDPVKAAKEYAEEAFSAYQKLIS